MSVASPGETSVNISDWNSQSVTIKSPAHQRPKRHRKILPLDVKLKIIEEFESGKAKKVILKEYNLQHSTLFTILESKDKIRELVNSDKFNPALGRKKNKASKYGQLEEILWEKLKQVKKKLGIKGMTGPVISNLALEIAAERGWTDFKAYSGWLYRFRHRHGLIKNPEAQVNKAKTLTAEKVFNEVSDSVAKEWADKVLPDILRKFDAKDIFTLHETGLYFRCTPENMLHFVGERCVAGKMPKERLTVMMVCNMTGTEMLPLLVVGRYIRPKSLKYVHTLPTEYLANTRSWMIPLFFEEWIKRFDATMQESWRRVALFLAPSVTHPCVQGLNAVTMVFFPNHINHQPAHQGIISALKLNYRRIQLQHINDYIDFDRSVNKVSISLLDALLWLREAWKAVGEECIQHAFKRAGFHSEALSNASSADLPNYELNNKEYCVLFQQVSNKMPTSTLTSAESFLGIDTLLATCGHVKSIELAMAQVNTDPGRGNTVVDQDEGDITKHDGDPDDLPLSIQEARQCLDTLRNFFQHHETGQEDNLKEVAEMEHHIHKMITLSNGTFSGTRQTTMLDFFTKRGIKKARVPKPTDSYYFPKS